jgi:peptidoglycan/xylan/chitin deacetylase (PgdA/CDA1 family)
VHGFYMILRHFFCGALAIGVIVSGRVRRAKKKVLNSNVVTAIYFHNPNKRLFARCVTWLTKNGYTFISDDDLINILHRGLEPSKGAVWLSFDDGFKDLCQNVIPLSRQCNVPITLFIPSEIIAGNGLFPWLHRTANGDFMRAGSSEQNGMRDSMTVADVKRIARYPEVRIGSHTAWHTVTSNLSDEQARFEFCESKTVLESWTGQTITSFAYPEGRLSGRECRFLVECGYKMAATTESTLVTHQSDPYLVPRFHVGDNIPFPEAICNMVGVWRPAIDPFIHTLAYWRDVLGRLRHRLQNQRRTHRGIPA